MYGDTSSTVNIVESNIAKSSSQAKQSKPQRAEPLVGRHLVEPFMVCLKTTSPFCEPLLPTPMRYPPVLRSAMLASFITAVACQGGGGGAVAAIKAIAVIHLSTFFWASAQEEGGALSFTGKSSLSLKRSVFEAVTAVSIELLKCFFS